MSINDTKKWFEQALPEPTAKHACIQIGCHLEEVAEMLDSLGDDCDAAEINDTANHYKRSAFNYISSIKSLSDQDKIDLLDSLADQIVTAIGVAHTFGFDIVGALKEVNRSNFSKFEDGEPVFDYNGKITKGKNYTPPNLKPFV